MARHRELAAAEMLELFLHMHHLKTASEHLKPCADRAYPAAVNIVVAAQLAAVADCGISEAVVLKEYRREEVGGREVAVVVELREHICCIEKLVCAGDIAPAVAAIAYRVYHLLRVAGIFYVSDLTAVLPFACEAEVEFLRTAYLIGVGVDCVEVILKRGLRDKAFFHRVEYGIVALFGNIRAPVLAFYVVDGHSSGFAAAALTDEELGSQPE